MTRLTRIDRDTTKTIQPIIDAALIAAASKLGLKVSYGSWGYDPQNGKVTVKLTLQLVDQAGITTEARRNWEAYHEILSLPPDGLGRGFKGIDGKTYVITDLVPGGDPARDARVITRRSDDAPDRFQRWPVTQLRAALAMQAAERISTAAG